MPVIRCRIDDLTHAHLDRTRKTFAMCFPRTIADSAEAWGRLLGTHSESWCPNFSGTKGMDIPIDPRFDFLSVS